MVKCFAVYNIDGDIYLKLRDLAMALNDTGAQFANYLCETAQTILCTGEPFTTLGGELTTEDGLKMLSQPPYTGCDDKTQRYLPILLVVIISSGQMTWQSSWL